MMDEATLERFRLENDRLRAELREEKEWRAQADRIAQNKQDECHKFQVELKAKDNMLEKQSVLMGELQCENIRLEQELEGVYEDLAGPSL